MVPLDNGAKILCLFEGGDARFAENNPKKEPTAQDTGKQSVTIQVPRLAKRILRKITTESVFLSTKDQNGEEILTQYPLVYKHPIEIAGTWKIHIKWRKAVGSE